MDPMWDYIVTCRPVVVVMAPPCKGMAGWGPFNKLVNNEAWKKSVAVSTPLGKLCGEVALHQLSVGLHFFNEHPVRSALYHLPPWKKGRPASTDRHGHLGPVHDWPSQHHHWIADAEAIRGLGIAQAPGLPAAWPYMLWRPPAYSLQRRGSDRGASVDLAAIKAHRGWGHGHLAGALLGHCLPCRDDPASAQVPFTLCCLPSLHEEE